MPLGAEEDRDDLLLDGQRRVLRLLEQLDQTCAALELGLGGLVEVGGEGREGLQLAVLGQVQAETSCHLFHRLDLGGATDAGHRHTDVDGRTHALVEQVGLQEHLAVGDRDDVGGDVGRDVVGLGLDDRQTGHRTATEFVGQLRATLQQTGVQIEDVTRVGLAARRAAQQQRDGAVGLGLLGQVVEHDQHVLAVVHPLLRDGRTGVRGQPLEAGGVRGGRGDDGGVLHGAALLQSATHGGDGGALLTDRDVDAADLLVRVTGQPGLTLVEDGVHADGGLAGLAVADDQLTLTPADRGHGVDGLDAGLQRLVDALALHHRRGLKFERAGAGGGDLAATVDRFTERVDHATEERVADRHREHLTGALDLLALLDLLEVAEDDGADAVLVEVERHSQHATGELQQLLGHHRRQALDVGDTVAGVDDGADLLATGAGLEARDIARDGAFDVVSGDCQLCHGFSSSSCFVNLVVRVISRAAWSRRQPAWRPASRR